MRCAIVYSSQTGNTALLAQRLKAMLSISDLVYYGAPDGTGAVADVIWVGFWTDKGSSDELVSAFLRTLQDKKVFLFGTAGFGGSEAYFAQILSRVQENLNPSNTVVGSYMCQGKMPASVRQRYEALQVQQPEQMRQLIENFDAARSHPNQAELDGLESAAAKAICTLRECCQ